jgi:hypothetical protein
MIKIMKHRFLFIIALLLTAATGAWAQDPDPIDLTSSANGTVWTLSSMPANITAADVTAPTAVENLKCTALPRSECGVAMSKLSSKYTTESLVV